jgi:hypothetical protein
VLSFGPKNTGDTSSENRAHRRRNSSAVREPMSAVSTRETDWVG